MLELLFTARDLASTRFAFSPLWEVVASVRVLKSPGDHVLHRRWVEEVRPRLDSSGLDWSLLSDLVPVPTREIPDFVCPPPLTPLPDLRIELATMRASQVSDLRASLDRLPQQRTDGIADLYADPAEGLRRLSEVIEDYWELALAPYWPRILAVCEADVLYRGRRLTETGARQLLNELDPSVSWKDDRLHIEHRTVSATRSLGGRGLLLTPSVFIWPRVFSVSANRSQQPTLRYTPRGVATLWESSPTTVSTGLVGVLGRSRALLLTELEHPASTKDLAGRTGITPGGVSQHLTALRAGGLVTAHRSGRYVLYARTTVAEELLAGGGTIPA